MLAFNSDCSLSLPRVANSRFPLFSLSPDVFSSRHHPWVATDKQLPTYKLRLAGTPVVWFCKVLDIVCAPLNALKPLFLSISPSLFPSLFPTSTSHLTLTSRSPTRNFTTSFNFQALSSITSPLPLSPLSPRALRIANSQVRGLVQPTAHTSTYLQPTLEAAVCSLQSRSLPPIGVRSFLTGRLSRSYTSSASTSRHLLHWLQPRPLTRRYALHITSTSSLPCTQDNSLLSSTLLL